MMQKLSDRHEKKAAKVYGGRLTSNSGAGWVDKGDVQTEDEVIECKATGKTQITLKAAWLEKVFREAAGRLKRPVLEFQLHGVEYVVLTRHSYMEMREKP